MRGGTPGVERNGEQAEAYICLDTGWCIQIAGKNS